MGESLDRRVVDDSVSVAAWTTVSRATGFARVIVIAAVLGPTFFGNLFQAANQLPWVIYELAAGSLLASLLVPPLVARIDAGEDPERLGRQFITVVIGVFAAVSAVVMLAAPLISWALSRNIVDPVEADRYRSFGILLIALTAPQLVGYGVIATATAVQNAHGRFAFAAAVPAVENLLVIGLLFVYAAGGRAGLEVTELARSDVLLLGLGSSFAVLVHVVLQWTAAARLGVRLFPGRIRLDEEFRSILRLSGPASGSAALNGVRHLVLLLAMGAVPGGVVAYQLAVNFLNLPIALGARPVAVALLPQLSRLDGQGSTFQSSYTRGLSLAGLVAIPAAVAFALFAPSLGAASAFGEMESDAGRALVTAAIAGISLGVLGEALYQVATHASFARRSARPPFQAMLFRASTAVLAAFILVPTVESGPLLVGLLGLAASLGDVVGGWMVHRQIVSGAVATVNRHLAITASIALGALAPAALLAFVITTRWPEPPISTAITGGIGIVAAGLALTLRLRLDPGLRDDLLRRNVA